MQDVTPEINQTLGQNVLDTERIGKLLVSLSLPSFFGLFVQTLYNVVNTIFIGHFVGALAIAGLSIVFPLQMLAMGIGMMVGLGGGSLISRHLGAGNHAEAERVLGNGVAINIIFSLALTAIVLSHPDFWLRLIGASDEVLPFAKDYVVIIMLGNVPNVFAMTLLNFVRAEGNARVGMTAMIMGAVLNIILDSILIIWLRLGVKGAAMGTVIAQTVSLVYLLSYYFTGSSYLKIRTTHLRLDIKILKPMLAIGAASFMRTVAGSLSAMFIIRTVVALGGDYALSAFGIIQRVFMFAMMPAVVIGQGLQPVLGYNYGARRFGLALKSLTMAFIAATLFSILVYLILHFLPGPIMSVFTTDESVIAAGTYAMRRIFMALPLIGVMMVGSSAFQSIGKATQAFVTAVARPIGFLIPSIMVLPNLLGLDGVWLSFPVADTLTFVLTVLLTVPIIREFRRAAAKTPAEGLAGAPL
jgi:putative MATE family efflux protein